MITAVQALHEAGCEVLGVVSIFTYELSKGKAQLDAEGITNHSLSNYSTLVEVAKEQGYITTEDVEKLTKWRENPEDLAWLEA